MKSENLAIKFEKILDKVENMSHHLNDEFNQQEFETLKNQIIENLEGIIEILHNDEEVELIKSENGNNDD